MISFESILKVCKYQIVDGECFQWSCYGPNARYLILGSEHATVDVVFDSVTKTIYEVQVLARRNSDTDKFAAYLLFNPKFKAVYINECAARNVDPLVVCDDDRFIEIEDEQVFLSKLECVFDGTDFDSRAVVALQLTESEYETLAHMASTLEITLDQLVERILREAIPEK